MSVSTTRDVFNAFKRAADGSMQLGRVPLPEMPAELKQVVEEQKS